MSPQSRLGLLLAASAIALQSVSAQSFSTITLPLVTIFCPATRSAEISVTNAGQTSLSLVNVGICRFDSSTVTTGVTTETLILTTGVHVSGGYEVSSGVTIYDATLTGPYFTDYTPAPMAAATTPAASPTDAAPKQGSASAPMPMFTGAAAPRAAVPAAAIAGVIGVVAALA